MRLDQIQRPISADILLFRSNGRENVNLYIHESQVENKS